MRRRAFCKSCQYHCSQKGSWSYWDNQKTLEIFFCCQFICWSCMVYFTRSVRSSAFRFADQCFERVSCVILALNNRAAAYCHFDRPQDHPTAVWIGWPAPGAFGTDRRNMCRNPTHIVDRLLRGFCHRVMNSDEQGWTSLWEVAPCRAEAMVKFGIFLLAALLTARWQCLKPSDCKYL